MTSSNTHEDCALITKRNGAYLVAMIGARTDDATPDELYDCASNLATAKRVAKEHAKAFGYVNLRWLNEVGFVAVLQGMPS